MAKNPSISLEVDIDTLPGKIEVDKLVKKAQQKVTKALGNLSKVDVTPEVVLDAQKVEKELKPQLVKLNKVVDKVTKDAAKKAEANSFIADAIKKGLKETEGVINSEGKIVKSRLTKMMQGINASLNAGTKSSGDKFLTNFKNSLGGKSLKEAETFLNSFVATSKETSLKIQESTKASVKAFEAFGPGIRTGLKVAETYMNDFTTQQRARMENLRKTIQDVSNTKFDFDFTGKSDTREIQEVAKLLGQEETKLIAIVAQKNKINLENAEEVALMQKVEQRLDAITNERERLLALVQESTVASKAEATSLKNSRAHAETLKKAYYAVGDAKKRIQGYSGKEEAVIQRQVAALKEQQAALRGSLNLRKKGAEGSKRELAYEEAINAELKKIDVLITEGQDKQKAVNTLKKAELAEQKRITAQHKATRKEIQGYLFDARELNKALNATKTSKVDDAGLKSLKESIALVAKLDTKITAMRKKHDDKSIVLSERDLENLNKAQARAKGLDLELKKILTTTERIISANKNLATSLRVGQQADALAEVNAALNKQVAAKTQINQLHGDELKFINGKEVLELDQEIERLTKKKLHLEQIQKINKEIESANAKAALLQARGNNAATDKSRLDILKKELNLREDLLAKMKAINDTPNSGVSFNEQALQKEANAVLALRKQVDGLTQSLSKNASEATELDAANKHLAKTLKAQEDAVTGVATAAGLSASKQIASLQRLEKAIQDSLVAYKSQAKAAERAGTDTKQYAAEIARLHKELAKTERALNGPTRSVSEFSNSLRLFFRYAVAYRVLGGLERGFRAVTGAVVELDKSLVSIQAVANATAEDMVTIENAIKNVATTTKFSTAEIAEAAQVLAQAGIGPDSIAATLESVANFASATNASLAIAADLVSTMKNVFKELSVEDIADKLANTVNISKTTAADLQTILSRLAQTSGSFNIDADQMLAAVSVLKNVGIKASTVSTGLRQGLLELLSPDAKTLKVLEKRYDAIGQSMSQQAIRGMFTGFAETDNPLLAVLNELEKLGISGSGSEDFQRLFDVRAENVIKALIKNKEQFIANTQAIQRTGSAAKGAKTQLESLSNAADNLGAVISVLASDISGNLVEGLKDLVAQATEATNSFKDMLKARQEATGESGVGDIAEVGLSTGVAAKASGLGVVKSAVLGVVAAAVSGVATAYSGPKDQTVSKISDAVSTIGEIITGLALYKAFFPKKALDAASSSWNALKKVGPKVKGLGKIVAFGVTRMNLIVGGIIAVGSLIYSFAKDTSGDAIKAIEAQRDAIASRMAETRSEIAKIEAEIKRQEVAEINAKEVQQDLAMLDEAIGQYLDNQVVQLASTVEEVLALADKEGTVTDRASQEIKDFLDKAAQGTKDVQSAAFQNMKAEFEELLGLTKGALSAYDLSTLLQSMSDQVTKAEGVRAEFQKTLDAALRDPSLVGSKELVEAFKRATDAEKKILLGRITNQEDIRKLYEAIDSLKTIDDLTGKLKVSKESLEESIVQDLEAKARAYAQLERDLFQAKKDLSEYDSGGTLPFGLSNLLNIFTDRGELNDKLKQAEENLKTSRDVAYADLLVFAKDNVDNQNALAEAVRKFGAALGADTIARELEVASENATKDFLAGQNAKVTELQKQIENPKELQSLQEAVVDIEGKKLAVAEESIEIDIQNKALNAEKQGILKQLIALEKKKAGLVNEDAEGKKKYDSEIKQLRLDLTGVDKKILSTKKVQQDAEEKLAEQARGQLFEEGRLKDITEEIARAKGAAVKDTVLIASLIEEQYKIEKELLEVKKKALEANIIKLLRAQGIDSSGQSLDQLLGGLDNEGGKELLKSYPELAKFVKEGIEVQDQLNKAQQVYTDGIKDLKKIAIDEAKKRLDTAKKENDSLKNTATVIQNKLNDASDALVVAREGLAKAYDEEISIIKTFSDARKQINGEGLEEQDVRNNLKQARNANSAESAKEQGLAAISDISALLSQGEISKREAERLLNEAEQITLAAQRKIIADLKFIEMRRHEDVRALQDATRQSWEAVDKNTVALDATKTALASLENSLANVGASMSKAAGDISAAAARSASKDGTKALQDATGSLPNQPEGETYSTLPSPNGDLTKAVKIVDKDGNVTYTSNSSLINDARETGKTITSMADGLRTGEFPEPPSPEQIVKDLVTAALGGALNEEAYGGAAPALVEQKVKEIINSSLTPEEAEQVTPEVSRIVKEIIASSGTEDTTEVAAAVTKSTVAAVEAAIPTELENEKLTVAQKVTGGVVSVVKELFTAPNVEEHRSNLALTVGAKLGEAVDEMMAYDYVEKAEELADTVKNKTSEAVDAVLTYDYEEKAEELADAVKNKTTEAVGALLNYDYLEKAEEVSEAVKTKTSEAVDAVLTYDYTEKAAELATTLQEKVGTAVTDLFALVSETTESAQALVNAIVTPLGELVSSATEEAQRVIVEGFHALINSVDIGPLIETYGRLFRESADSIVTGGKSAGASIKASGAEVSGKVVQAGEDLAAAIRSAISRIAAAAAAASAAKDAPQKKADGGYIRGPGSTTSDDIPVMLSDKEYVLDAKTTENIGVDNLDNLRKRKGLAKGGMVKKGNHLASGGLVKPMRAHTTLDRDPITVPTRDELDPVTVPENVPTLTDAVDDVQGSLAQSSEGIKLSGYDVTVAFWGASDDIEDSSDDAAESIYDAGKQVSQSLTDTATGVGGASQAVKEQVTKGIDEVSEFARTVAEQQKASDEYMRNLYATSVEEGTITYRNLSKDVSDGVTETTGGVLSLIDSSKEKVSSAVDSIASDLAVGETPASDINNLAATLGEETASAGTSITTGIQATAENIVDANADMTAYWASALEEQKAILASNTIGWAQAFNMEAPLSELQKTINEFTTITAISQYNSGVEGSRYTDLRRNFETGYTDRTASQLPPVYAKGGPVSGPGTGTSDSILARLSNGEFVVDAKTTKNVGADNLANLPKFSTGGLLDLMKPNKIDRGSLLSSRNVATSGAATAGLGKSTSSSAAAKQGVTFNVGGASLSGTSDPSDVAGFQKALNLARLKGGNKL